MSETAIRAVFVNPKTMPGQAHTAAKRFLAQCDEMFASGVERIAATACPEEELRSLERNSEYWGFVLRPISEQAQIDGIGATAEGWHDYFRKMFLGYVFKKVRMPGKKRPSIKRELKSTTKLSEKAMRTYCEQVRAHAATTFGVTFPALEDKQ
jgi:hypothetical protein